MPQRAIEATLRGNLDDEQAWAVLGDLLSAQGDRRGELIALEQRILSAERVFERQVLRHQADDLFAAHYKTWLGALADSGDIAVSWRRGYITVAKIRQRLNPTLAILLELPASALLHTLEAPRAPGVQGLAAQLADWGRLETLRLPDPGFERVEPLARLETLEELALTQASITDLDSLRALPALSQLDLHGLRTSLQGLGEGFEALRRLNLSFHGHPDADGADTLQPLARLEQLEALDLGHAGWVDLSPLGALRRLEELVLASTDAFDLRPLGALAALRELDLRGSTSVADIEPLAGLSELEILRLNYTRVTDLRPLRVLPKLRVLDISGTAIHSVDDLMALPALERVVIHGSEIRDVEALISRGVRVDGRPPARVPSWRDIADEHLRDTDFDDR